MLQGAYLNAKKYTAMGVQNTALGLETAWTIVSPAHSGVQILHNFKIPYINSKGMCTKVYLL
jgi:hypothetical protein